VGGGQFGAGIDGGGWCAVWLVDGDVGQTGEQFGAAIEGRAAVEQFGVRLDE
jgi:hypothetical protein